MEQSVKLTNALLFMDSKAFGAGLLLDQNASNGQPRKAPTPWDADRVRVIKLRDFSDLLHLAVGFFYC